MTRGQVLIARAKQMNADDKAAAVAASRVTKETEKLTAKALTDSEKLAAKDLKETEKLAAKALKVSERLAAKEHKEVGRVQRVCQNTDRRKARPAKVPRLEDPPRLEDVSRVEEATNTEMECVSSPAAAPQGEIAPSQAPPAAEGNQVNRKRTVSEMLAGSSDEELEGIQQDLPAANTRATVAFGQKFQPPDFMLAPAGVSFTDEMNGKINGWPEVEKKSETEQDRIYKSDRRDLGWGSGA